MAISLTGARGLFSHIQEAICHVYSKRVALTRGIHSTLVEFQRLAEDLVRCPTWLYELVPLHTNMYGYHNASGYMCGGAVLPGPTSVPRTPQQHPISVTIFPEPAGKHPIVCQTHFPTDITSQLVYWVNPEVQVTNSDLELVGRVIHHAFISNCFDMRDQNPLSIRDNTAGLCWHRKGSSTSTFPSAHLLRPQSIHQRFYRYIPCHGFLEGVDNGISDRPSRSRYLTDADFHAYMDDYRPQKLPWGLCIPPSELVYVIASMLRQITLSRGSLIVEPLQPMVTGRSGPSSVGTFPSTPY